MHFTLCDWCKFSLCWAVVGADLNPAESLGLSPVDTPSVCKLQRQGCCVLVMAGLRPGVPACAAAGGMMPRLQMGCKQVRHHAHWWGT